MAESWFEFIPEGAHLQDATISSATTLTKPSSGASKLLIQAVDQNLRFTLDGTAPTTSKGFVLEADKPPVLIQVGEGVTVKVIEETATGGVEYQWGR